MLVKRLCYGLRHVGDGPAIKKHSVSCNSPGIEYDKSIIVSLLGFIDSPFYEHRRIVLCSSFTSFVNALIHTSTMNRWFYLNI